MLADQDTSVRDQCICTFFFEVKACPAVCVFNFHSYGWAFALSTKIERSISGNNLCIWECTNITHLAVIFCNCAVFDHLIQFETGNNTGYITSFINICKIVVHIGKSACCCLSSCCMAELYIRIFGSGLNHIILKTEAVGENDLAALFSQVNSSIVAALVFRYVEFGNNLVISQSKGLFHLFDTQHVSIAVTFLLIANVDDADFQISGINGIRSGS